MLRLAEYLRAPLLQESARGNREAWFDSGREKRTLILAEYAEMVRYGSGTSYMNLV